MLDYIEKLRNKPDPEKRKAILLISLCITLCIAAIWGVFLFMRVSTMDFSIKDDQVTKSMPSFWQSLTGFSDKIGTIFNNAEQAYEAASSSSAQ